MNTSWVASSAEAWLPSERTARLCRSGANCRYASARTCSWPAAKAASSSADHDGEGAGKGRSLRGAKPRFSVPRAGSSMAPASGSFRERSDYHIVAVVLPVVQPFPAAGDEPELVRTVAAEELPCIKVVLVHQRHVRHAVYQRPGSAPLQSDG